MADDCNAALDLKPIAAVNQLHLGAIGFVAIWGPDFAAAVFSIAFGCNVPNDVFAHVTGVRGAAIPFKACDQFTTNGVAALFHLNMAVISVVIRNGFPCAKDRVRHRRNRQNRTEYGRKQRVFHINLPIFAHRLR